MGFQAKDETFPFLKLSPHLQDVVARKLAADTFHKLATVINFTQNKKSWILPFDKSLTIVGDYVYVDVIEPTTDSERSNVTKKKWTDCQITNFESLCSIKFKKITVHCDGEESVQRAREFIERTGNCAEYLELYMKSFDDQNEYSDIIKAIAPNNLCITAVYSYPKKLLKEIARLEFTHLNLKFLYGTKINIRCGSFNCQNLKYSIFSASDVMTISFINTALSKQTSQNIELCIQNTEEDFVRIVQHFQHRLSILYDPETHEHSIFYQTVEKGLSPYYVLFSDYCYKKMWLLFYKEHHLHFKRITFNEFDNIFHISCND